MFQQTAVIDQYLCAPWIAYFALRVAHDGDGRWRHWIGLGVFLGLSCQSYYFAGSWLLLGLLAVGLLLFRRDTLRASLAAPHTGRKALAAAALVLAMALPNAVVLAERESAVFPARMLDHDFVGREPLGGPLQYEPKTSVVNTGVGILGYGLVHYTGTFATVWDFIQLLAPQANTFARGNDAQPFGRPSEAFMYVGLLGYLVALLGMAFGRHPLKRVWLVVMIAFALLMLGPAGGLHRPLAFTPPLWGVRHTHAFVSFFLLGVLYFFVLGCEFVALRILRYGDDRSTLAAAVPARLIVGTVALVVTLLATAGAFLAVWDQPRTRPSIDWEWTFVIVALLVTFAACRMVGRIGVVLAIVAANLAIVFWHVQSPIPLAWDVLLFLALPVIAVLLSIGAPGRVRQALVFGAAAVLVVDLTVYVTRSHWLWHWPRPDRAVATVTRPVAPELPATRVSMVPPGEQFALYTQPVRYLSLLTRQAAAFATPMYSEETPEAYFTSVVLPLPNGGEPITLAPGASHAMPVASPATRQGSWGLVRARSDNRAPGAVSVEMRAGRRTTRATYGNSGEWEPLMVRSLPSREPVSLVYRVDARATAGASFAQPVVRVVSEGPAAARRFDLELVRDARRWNSFLIPKRYFDLVHAPLPATALGEILGIDRPLLQFRASATRGGLDRIVASAAAVSPAVAHESFRNTLYVEGPVQSAGASGSTTPGAIRLAAYRHDRLDVAVDAPTAGYVHVLEGFDHHWRATVNGSAAPVVPANAAFFAVAVPAGRSHVTLEYVPLPFRAALYIYFGSAACGLAVVLGAPLATRVRAARARARLIEARP